MKKKCLLFVFLLTGVMMVAQTVFSNEEKAPAGNESQSKESLEQRLEREGKERFAAVGVAGEKAISDQYTGKTFKAIGKEWRVEQYNISWTETQSWISSLGDGWRAPTYVELKALYDSVGMTSAIGNDVVWGEQNDSKTAWRIDFRNGEETSLPIAFRSFFTRAVAVR